MCKQRDCGCGTKGGIKPTLKYCGSELPCTGIVKGDDYTTVLQKIDAVACSGGEVVDSCNGLYLSLNPLPSETYIKVPEIVVTGGTAPYTYEWSLQQTGGTSYTIGNTTTDNYITMLSSMTRTYDNCTGTQSEVPCRVSYGNVVTDPTHAWHFKLEVTDANGCKVRDYWTHYQVFTF